ncbi:sarcosine oxidase subunit gamma [Ralstonia pseudosolanacearum]|uniref:sarcosine oxidase subunit gamma n=1 Tax=Ralstonia pseudosolanacearum TaxID=1310165 RepID=UPI0008DA278E|nr:sarcosine oxidase subunit gamma [Ralstonia pseudosolanacearum]MCL1620034.1 sarcosine oxidase subunit gamma [Ralstonia pseudosolanacearum CaRs-Mep]MCQ4680413.1 sarcosine oxidase subunit gamma [Ralstonia pseudosolanacearum]MDO3522438.1 sarcosine oxidase subunit gamma [Ralstonia pseudosolanacearum]MDO3546129.1 sarcosine oxidase subunit gamma [Ralstonia pseudosolanacearum]MDO3553109.1 sarcosine oxidase subunit gamma [Ralstonia pseudosolanacearum]
MWNETRSEAQVAGMGGVRLESPCVGAAELLRTWQARAPDAFMLRERPFLDLVNVRGELSDPAFLAAFERVIGCRPPAAPNTVARSAEYDVLWLGPDEWLVRSNGPVRAGVLEAKLAQAVQGSYAAAVDVGSGYTVIEISGKRARDVLTRGCPLDLHPRAFKPGRCAQSHCFKASIVLIPIGNDTYEIVVRRSFADYLVRIMLDAATPLTS